MQNEKDHKALLASALGSNRPTGLGFKIPAGAVSRGKALSLFGTDTIPNTVKKLQPFLA